MKDFKPTVMMTKLNCICLPRSDDGWPLRHCCPHWEWRQSTATPRPTQSQRSLQELTAVVTEEEGLWLGWRRCCTMSLCALLVASEVRSPCIHMQEHIKKPTKGCRYFCGQNSTLGLSSGFATVRAQDEMPLHHYRLVSKSNTDLKYHPAKVEIRPGAGLLHL